MGVDDTIIQKMIKDTPMNRTDGMGLISYSQALKWSKEMGLDYVPSQFCVRQSYLKGMLCVFPIHEFCLEINGGNYLVDTIYKDKNGNYIKADMNDKVEEEITVTECLKNFLGKPIDFSISIKSEDELPDEDDE